MQRKYEHLTDEVIALLFQEHAPASLWWKSVCRLLQGFSKRDARWARLIDDYHQLAQRMREHASVTPNQLFEEIYIRFLQPIDEFGRPWGDQPPPKNKWLFRTVKELRSQKAPVESEGGRHNRYNADAVNEVMSRLAVKMPDILLNFNPARGDGVFARWLKRIAKHEFFAMLRGKVKERSAAKPPDQPQRPKRLAADQGAESWFGAFWAVWDVPEHDTGLSLRQRGVLQVRFGVGVDSHVAPRSHIAAAFAIPGANYDLLVEQAIEAGGLPRRLISMGLRVPCEVYDRLLEQGKAAVRRLLTERASQGALDDSIAEAFRRHAPRSCRPSRRDSFFHELGQRLSAEDIELLALQLGLAVAGAEQAVASRGDSEIAKLIKAPPVEARRRLFLARRRFGSVVREIVRELQLRGVPRKPGKTPANSPPNSWPQLIRRALDALDEPQRRLILAHLQIPLEGCAPGGGELELDQLAAVAGLSAQRTPAELDFACRTFVEALKAIDPTLLDCLARILQWLPSPGDRRDSAVENGARRSRIHPVASAARPLYSRGRPSTLGPP